MDWLSLTLTIFILMGFVLACVTDFYNPIGEQYRFMMFIICAVFHAPDLIVMS